MRGSLCLLSGWLLLASGVAGAAPETDEAGPVVAPRPLQPLDEVDGPIPDDFVVAEIDGARVRFGTLMERLGYTRRLQEVASRISPAQLRRIQEEQLRRNLPGYVESRLVSRKMRDELTAEQAALLEERLDQAWQTELQKLFERENVETAEELSARLAENGHPSLAILREQWSERLLVTHYLRPLVAPLKTRDDQRQAVDAVVAELRKQASVQTVLDDESAAAGTVE